MRAASYIDKSTIDTQTQKWLSKIKSQTAPRPNLTFQPRGAALLVIDMLHYFASPKGRSYLPATKAIVPQIQALIDAFRTNGLPIVFTQHCHEGEHDLGMLGRFFSDFIQTGKPESEIIAALQPLETEPVVQKKTYDAFLDTELHPILEKQGVHQVIITGVLTHMCCETTARSAFCRGFEVYLPADATASNCEERHLGALMGLADAVAIIMSTKEILERF